MNEILNKIKIIKHKINIRFKMIVVFVNKIIKLLNFDFMKTCLKIILNFVHYN